MNEENVLTWRDYYVTLLILFANIIGFILCTQMGEVVYNVGSMNAEKILADGQYYRLLSSMFLHADIGHIVSNMIFLAGLGQMIEHAIGHAGFAVLYLLSGLGAGICSMFYSVITGELYNSVGASGAVFGLIGALFILVVVHNGTFGSVSIGRLVFAVAYMIYTGANSESVDNAAHVGGLVCGILIMAVMNVIMVFRKPYHVQK
ncbi:MAG: rhomboid family intramembrane serine protease [Lachnospiraceae bacterium]|nr:rhomboid family intramembrane serine protease [Lachnospiraceae bacterium]MBO5144727.1 rhomboid family intramembrane serine protease [Lachnospiraceae bacterium]